MPKQTGLEFKFDAPKNMHATVNVKLDGKLVGRIAHTAVTDEHKGGWQYTPLGSRTGGDIFPSLVACQKSLAAPTSYGTEKEFVEAARALAPLFGVVKAATGISAERIIAAAGDPQAEREILRDISNNARRDAGRPINDYLNLHAGGSRFSPDTDAENHDKPNS